MAYEDFKDLPRRTTSDKVLCEKSFNIAKNPRYDEYWPGVTSMVCNVFDKKSSGGAVARAQWETLAARTKSDIKSETLTNQQLAEELHESVIRKFERKRSMLIF